LTIPALDDHRWITGGDTVRGNVPSHDSSSRNNRIAANADTLQDNDILTKPNSISDNHICNG
jgi:hypothetical protein